MDAERERERERVAQEEDISKHSLFPLFPASSGASSAATTAAPQWLCNPSFDTDLAAVNNAVSFGPATEEEEEIEEEEHDQASQQPMGEAYELLEEEDEAEFYAKRKKKRKKTKKSTGKERALSELGSRKSVPSKDYYFDSHPDPDNLAYGSLYRMDIPRYKPFNFEKSSGLMSQRLYRWNQMGSMFDQDSDVDTLDAKLMSNGRYWSAKNAALERHKNIKRIRLFAPEKSADIVPPDFIPMSDDQLAHQVDDASLLSKKLVIEESWEDEVLRKTREFNMLTRERPHDDKAWMAFAEFQEKVASMQPQKGARLQTLEKKISILEKATELNPDNEELLLCLMKAYRKRDNTDVLMDRWEKVLISNSGSFKLWREFLHVLQGEFSRFKVSSMRKMYAHAIQALSATCCRHARQVHQISKPLDPAGTRLELGLVNIFLSLCRFEWQAGYQELATALFQAQLEYSLLCPSLLLTEQNKQRLFEHFWNSGGARIGEEGALGWAIWMEKEEESRQRVLKEENLDNNDKGGWTGWSEPLSKDKETSVDIENKANSDVSAEELENEAEVEGNQEDDTEALLKELGIDVDAETSGKSTDTLTWTRWSKEESLRDCNQWMPFHAKNGLSLSLSLSLSHACIG